MADANAEVALEREFRIPLLIAVITFVAFIPALSGAFVQWDDNANFLENPYFRGWTAVNLKWMWTTFHMGHYVPLSWMSETMDHSIWGMNAFGYHLTNTVLHCANAVLLFYVITELDKIVDPARRPSMRALAAGLGAMLFAVHPLRVESVAWITERRDVLSLFFELLSVLAYLSHARQARSSRMLVLAVVLYVCALLSKATVMTLPAILFVLNVYPLRRISLRQSWQGPRLRALIELIPFFALSVASTVLSMVALKPPKQLPLDGKVAVSAYSFMFYLWKTIAPTGLAPLYEMPRSISALEPRYLIAYVFTAVAVLAGAWITRRRPAIAIALLIYCIALSPMIGVVQNGPQIVADRYTYHCAPALAAIAGYGFALAITNWGAIATAGTVIILASLGGLTWQQCKVWQNSGALWNRVAVVNTDTSSIAETALGVIQMRAGYTDSAIVHFRKSIRVDPGYAETRNNLGNALVKKGEFEEALLEYQAALHARPNFADALANLGIMSARAGRLDDAIEYYRRAVENQPERVEAIVNWGNALVRLHRYDEAIGKYRQALALMPTSDDAELNWGVALGQQGKMEDAAAHFRQALLINPANAEAEQYLERTGKR